MFSCLYKTPFYDITRKIKFDRQPARQKSSPGIIEEIIMRKKSNYTGFGEKHLANENDEYAKISWKEKLSFCFGDPALTIVYTLTTTLLIYFYTNVIGISAGIVGIVMLLSRIFDGFSDFIMGMIIDRTHSKYGKARIWILRLVVPYAVMAVLLFTVPPIGVAGQTIYIFLTYNLMNTVIYTGISQPFHTLGSNMTRDRSERETICNIRMALSITGSMIITALTLPLINQVAAVIGHEQAAWILVTALYAIISILILLNTFSSTRERVRVSEQSEEKVSAADALKLLVKNRYFLISLGLMLFYTVYQIIIGTDLTYYCQYILGDVDLVMPISLAEKIPMIFVILCLPFLIPRFGKRNLIVGGCIMGIMGQLLFINNPASIPLAVITAVMRGVGMSSFYGVSFSLPSDAIEYGQWKTGTRIEGLMFASMSVGQKFGSGITSAVLGMYFARAGYDGTAAVQSAAANAAISNVYLFVPLAVWIIMLVIACFYSLDKDYGKMMSELAQREARGTL